MRRFTIRAKLILYLLIGILISAVLAISVDVVERDMMTEQRHVIDYLVNINSFKDTETIHLNWTSELKDYLLFKEPFDGELDYRQCEFTEWYDTYIKSESFNNSSTSNKEMVLDMREYHERLHTSVIEVINKCDAGYHEEAVELYENTTKIYSDALIALINKANLDLLERATASVNRARFLLDSFKRVHDISTILSILLTTVIGILAIRACVMPLSKFIKKIQVMNENETYEIIDDLHTNDEINDLIAVFNRMVRKVNTQQIELQEQNEELIAQGEELTAQNEEILEHQTGLQDALLKLTIHEERLTRLYKFSQMLNHTIDSEELMNNALRGLQDEVNAQVGAFMLYDENNQELRTKLSFGLLLDESLPPFKLGTGLAGRAAIERNALIANYGDSEMRTQGLYGELSMVSEIYLPLIRQEQLLGVVVLGRLDTNPFEDSEKKLLTALCDQIAVALDNALTHLETQEALSKVQELDQLKSEMINTVSHELRTPLASILGFAELLLVKQPNQDKSKKYISTIYNEADRLKLLINDFLDLQKIENGKMEFVREQVDIVELIKSSMNVYHSEDKHTLELDIAQNLPLVFTDSNRLKQVMGNLLSNAIKYSPEGGKIEVKVYQNSSEWLTISVKDGGLGIPEEAQQNLFQPFFRVDNSDRRKIGGTGLGLAICRNIVQALGGDIWVHSVYGQGSTFSFTLSLTNFNEIEEINDAK